MNLIWLRKNVAVAENGLVLKEMTIDSHRFIHRMWGRSAEAHRELLAFGAFESSGVTPTACRLRGVPRDIDVCFIGNTDPTAGAFTKYEIAKAIARRIPAFAHRLPRLRKLWMSEDPRQGLFDETSETAHGSAR